MTLPAEYSPLFLIQPEEAGELAHLEKQCFHSPWTAEQYAAMLKDCPTVCNPFFHPQVDRPEDRRDLMAGATPVFGIRSKSSNALVAYLSLAVFHTAAEMEIYNIAVHPDHRRCGLAKQLLHTAIPLAHAIGIERAFLEVRQSNTPAIALYSVFGFVACGLRKGYYTHPEEDALVMQCDLLHCQTKEKR